MENQLVFGYFRCFKYILVFWIFILTSFGYYSSILDIFEY